MTEQQWTGVVAVLGEDTGDGRQWSPDHPWALRATPAPLMTLPPDRRAVGTVEGVEVRDGLVHAWGTVWDSDAASAMFGDGTNPPTLFPAVDLDADSRQVRLIRDGEPYSYPDDYDDAMEAIDAGGVVMEFQAGTIMAVTLSDNPTWADRVFFEPVVGATTQR